MKQLVDGRATALIIDELINKINQHERVFIDIGAGDAAYAANIANENQSALVIAVEPEIAFLKEAAKSDIPDNVMLIQAGFEEFTKFCSDIADCISIVFPSGQLLEKVMNGDASFYSSIVALGRKNASIDIYISYCVLSDNKKRKTLSLPYLSDETAEMLLTELNQYCQVSVIFTYSDFPKTKWGEKAVHSKRQVLHISMKK